MLEIHIDLGDRRVEDAYGLVEQLLARLVALEDDNAQVFGHGQDHTHAGGRSHIRAGDRRAGSRLGVHWPGRAGVIAAAGAVVADRVGEVTLAAATLVAVAALCVTLPALTRRRAAGPGSPRLS